jgi:hypothetical protein
VIIDYIITILNYSITVDKDVVGNGNKFIICCLICFSDVKERGVSFQFLPTQLNIMVINFFFFFFCIDGVVMIYFKMLRFHMEFLRKK